MTGVSIKMVRKSHGVAVLVSGTACSYRLAVALAQSVHVNVRAFHDACATTIVWHLERALPCTAVVETDRIPQRQICRVGAVVGSAEGVRLAGPDVHDG